MTRVRERIWLEELLPDKEAKGQITPALSIGSRMEENQLDAELPAQSLNTNQSTAQQHERHATVGYRGSTTGWWCCATCGPI